MVTASLRVRERQAKDCSVAQGVEDLFRIRQLVLEETDTDHRRDEIHTASIISA